MGQSLRRQRERLERLAYVEPAAIRTPRHTCSSNVLKYVVPQGFPILTVGLACAICGHVYGYLDNVDAMREFERTHREGARPQRPFIVRGHIAAENLERQVDADEAKMYELLTSGLTPDETAEAIGLPRDYVRAIARLSMASNSRIYSRKRARV